MKIHTLILALLLANFIHSQTQTFDHSLFDNLLKDNVNNDGLVNYEAFANNDKFEQYIAAIGEADIERLSKENKLAFLINAYNALVIKNVNDHMPITSPLKVDGFFDKIKFPVAGKEMTLNELEYDYIFKIEPVLCHFGLVCAGKSCPKLLQKAYKGENIYKQLELNGSIFLNDPSKNNLDKENKTLYLSEVFKWFKDVFEEKYGSIRKTVAEFINNDDANFILNNDINIEYIKYNWNLNSQ